ncbi:MAG: signal transduction histidine kinase [Planctomycetota bacterium]|jgi:signal transduction histidine kinase
MSLRSKIVLILAIVVSVFSIGDNLIQRSMVGNSFRDLEGREAAKDLQRVVKALEGEQKNLERRAEDWSKTTRILNLCASSIDQEARQVFEPYNLKERDLHLVFVCAADGKVLSAQIEDAQSGESISVRDMPKGALSLQHPLLKLSQNANSTSGLLMTDHGVMLVGSHSVRDSKESDTMGTVILGRFLDEELLAALAEREQVAFSVWPVNDAPLPESEPGLLDSITTAPEPILHRNNDGTLQIYTAVTDFLSAPKILVRADIDPEITRRGQRSVNYALLSTVGTGLLIMFVLIRLLTRIVIGPLAKLTHDATQIGLTDDTSLRTGIVREDEIGQLSAEFDSMLNKLALSRQDVIRTSRLAGMSEIATGVLHNVGNVLNSVNVSANLVARQAEQLPVDDLAAMRDVLTAHENDLGDFISNHEQGKHLLPFINELTDALFDGKHNILQELNGMNSGVEHIGELVRSQQGAAGRQGVMEPTKIAEHMDSALLICQQAGNGKHIEIVRDYGELPKLEVDRHKLMEIVVNLIKNAFKAMDDPHESPMTLKLSLSYSEDARLEIRIKDSGCGIAEENLARIFTHGFTTCDDGNGFGLHVSANSATEMKGSLKVESGGLGHGACFVLELPAKEARVAVAA